MPRRQDAKAQNSQRLRSCVCRSLGYLWGTLASLGPFDPAPRALPCPGSQGAMLHTMKARKLPLLGAGAGARCRIPTPVTWGGLGRGHRTPRGDQVWETAGHLSPSLEERRSAGTAQGRAAPWRLSSRVEATGTGGCGVQLPRDRCLRPSAGEWGEGKGVEERPPRRLSCPVLSLPLTPVPFSVFSLFPLPAALPLFLPSPLSCPHSLSYPPLPSSLP